MAVVVLVGVGAGLAVAQEPQQPNQPEETLAEWAAKVEQAKADLMNEVLDCQRMAGQPATTNIGSSTFNFDLPNPADATFNLDYFVSDCDRKIPQGMSLSNLGGDWLGSGSVAVTTPGFALTRYQMYYDGGWILSMWRKFLGTFISGMWFLATVLLRLGVWAFDFVAAGRLSDIIGSIPSSISEVLDRDIVQGMQLRWVAVTAMGVAGGWGLVRQQWATAVGGVAFSLVALAVGGFVLANYNGYYQGAQATSSALVAEVLKIGDGSATTRPGQIDTPTMMAPLLDAAVHVPWEQLNFGRELSGDCEIRAGVDILVRVGGVDSTYPRDRISQCPGGHELALFNASASLERAFAVGVVTVGQTMIALLILSTAGMAMLSEVLMAAAFAVLPVAAVLVGFPGFGRNVAASWLTMLLQGITGLGIGVLFLRLILLVTTAVAENFADLALLERFMVFMLIAVGAFRLRKLVPKARAKVSATLAGKVATAGTPGGGGGVAPAVAGGVAGGLAGSAIRAHMLPAQGVVGAAKTAGKVGQKTTGALAAYRAVSASRSNLKVAAAQAGEKLPAGSGLLDMTKGPLGPAGTRGPGLAAAAGIGMASGAVRLLSGGAKKATTPLSVGARAVYDWANSPSAGKAAIPPSTGQTPTGQTPDADPPTTARSSERPPSGPVSATPAGASPAPLPPPPPSLEFPPDRVYEEEPRGEELV